MTLHRKTLITSCIAIFVLLAVVIFSAISRQPIRTVLS